MSVKIGSATDYQDLLNQLDSYLTGTGMALTPSFVGTGNGTIDAKGGSASVVEVITVTFTTATAFGVVGSISGSLGTGTVGAPFTSTKTNFTITAGLTAFVATDAFTFDVTPPWTSLRRTTGTEMIWQAPGNGGLDEIFVGAKTFFDVPTDYYNWRLGGFTGFDSALPFNQQAGYVGGPSQLTQSPILPLWNSTIPYWFIADGRRVIVIAKVSTVYMSCYLGFINSYMSPGAFPYPLLVAGSLAFSGTEPATSSPDWRWSFTGTEMAAMAIPHHGTMASDADSVARLRLPNGNWRGFCTNFVENQFGLIWPYGWVVPGSWDWRPNLDGGYSLLPLIMSDRIPNVYGEYSGVFAVTGFSQSAENTVTVNGVKHLVVQNIFRNTKSDFFAVRLN